MKRRDFIKTTGVLTTFLGANDISSLSASLKPSTLTNKLPKWRGFNLTDFIKPTPVPDKTFTTEEHLKWMRDWGFDFIRLPIAYPCYLDFDRNKDITPTEIYDIDERAIEKIDTLISMAHKYQMHVSINLHRAPGYCINAGFHEPYNLWKDTEAQEAFNFHWTMWAKRYKNVSSKKISFDLVNEPNMKEDVNEQFSKSGPVPGDVYRKVAKAAAEAIRTENPDHLIIADGNNIGKNVIPEITDLNIAQSCRGYYPKDISHYKAPWAVKEPDLMPEPKWPGQVGNQYLSRTMLEEFYKPWIELVKKGTGVHCGECGCWNKTPHSVFIAWFTDVLDILSENNIGFAIWNFIGDFGILDSGRQDVVYEEWYGHKLDKKFLELLIRH